MWRENLAIYGGTGFISGLLYERFLKNKNIFRRGMVWLPWIIISGILPILALVLTLFK